MNRTQRRRAKIKRRLTFAYAVAAVLTVGIIAVFVHGTSRQPAWSLAWLGGWAFTIYQLVMLVVHVRGVLRTHREYEDLIATRPEDPRGRRHAT